MKVEFPSDTDAYAVERDGVRVEVIGNKFVAFLPDGTVLPADGEDNGRILVVNVPNQCKRVIFPWIV